MLETAKMVAGRDINPQLFGEFPAQSILGGFATGELAAGKFPELPHCLCPRPFCDQQPAVHIDQYTGGDVGYFRG